MKTFISALLAVSVFASNAVETEGPTLEVRGADFAKLTITTDWSRDRDSSLDGEEQLSVHITQKAEMLNGNTMSAVGDRLQMWVCAPFVASSEDSYCVTYDVMQESSIDWDTQDLEDFHHSNDSTYDDVQRHIAQYVFSMPNAPSLEPGLRPTSALASEVGSVKVSEYNYTTNDDGGAEIVAEFARADGNFAMVRGSSSHSNTEI